MKPRYKGIDIESGPIWLHRSIFAPLRNPSEPFSAPATQELTRFGAQLPQNARTVSGQGASLIAGFGFQ